MLDMSGQFRHNLNMTSTRKFKPTTKTIGKPDKLATDLQNFGRAISAALKAEPIDITDELAEMDARIAARAAQGK